eukprot:m.56801 g.56801  ORF g.56801 m.56801 type:complete len:66 (-) comp22294_c0_seq1:39-236(-)
MLEKVDCYHKTDLDPPRYKIQNSMLDYQKTTSAPIFFSALFKMKSLKWEFFGVKLNNFCACFQYF